MTSCKAARERRQGACARCPHINRCLMVPSNVKRAHYDAHTLANVALALQHACLANRASSQLALCLAVAWLACRCRA